MECVFNSEDSERLGPFQMTRLGRIEPKLTEFDFSATSAQQFFQTSCHGVSCHVSPVARIFMVGAYLKNRDQIVNAIVNAMQLPKTHRGRVSILRTVKLKSGNF